MNKRAIVKNVIGAGCAIGAGIIVANVVVATTPLHTNFVARVLIKMGSLALSGATGEFVANYTDRTIDELVGTAQQLEEVVEQTKEAIDEANKVHNA